MIPAYCITLKTDGSRWPLFEKRAARVKDLHIQRFDAIDCRQHYKHYGVMISKSAKQKLTELEQSGERQAHSELTPGAIGCYLSHLGVMRRAYKLNHERVLIFEDDAVPPPNLAVLLQREFDQLDKMDKSWDILLLGYMTDDKPLLPVPIRLRQFYRLHAYVVTANAMAKILALALPMDKQLDSALSDLSDRIHIYGCVPQLVPNDDSVPTTIQRPVAPRQTPKPSKVVPKRVAAISHRQ